MTFASLFLIHFVDGRNVDDTKGERRVFLEF